MDIETRTTSHTEFVRPSQWGELQAAAWTDETWASACPEERRREVFRSLPVERQFRDFIISTDGTNSWVNQRDPDGPSGKVLRVPGNSVVQLHGWSGSMEMGYPPYGHATHVAGSAGRPRGPTTRAPKDS